MKRWLKITIVVLALVLVINVGIIVSLASNGVLQNKSTNNEDQAQAAEWVERDDVAQTRTIAVVSEESAEKKTEKKLTYENSRKLTEDQIVDVYRDENGAEFRYEGDRLVTVTDRSVLDQNLSSKGEYLDTKELVEIAKKHIKEVYGENTEGYVQDEIYGEGTSMVHVFFTKKYGKNGFVSGATISVSMTGDGKVYNSSLPYEKYLNFNEVLLNGITLETIENFIDKRMSEKNEEGKWAIDTISVAQQGGKYCLDIGVSITSPRVVGGIEIEAEETEVYYYYLE